MFVRLPNKTDIERWALFNDKTTVYIQEWLNERSPEGDHDLLFHNTQGAPLVGGTLHRELCRTFCTEYGGKVIREEGLEEWSTHRLRHKMASNLVAGGASMTTIMGAGGWKTASSMMLYAERDEKLARLGYDEAMRKVKDRSLEESEKRVLSPEEFLQSYGSDSPEKAAYIADSR